MQDELIDAALRQAPEVRIPANFRHRLLGSLPEPVAKVRYEWAWPAVWFASAAALAPLVMLALRSRLLEWLHHPVVTITALSMEAALSLIWFRRIVKARS